MKASPYLMALLMGQVDTADQPPSPIEKGKHPGEFLVRWDGLEISNVNDHLGGVRVAFLWNGRHVAYMRAEGAQIEGGATIHIDGLSGCQKMTISGAL